MEKNCHGLLAQIAADFDALVSEIDRTIERLTRHSGDGPDVQRLQRAKIIAETGANIIRDQQRDYRDV